jgi:hypothetical protein
VEFGNLARDLNVSLTIGYISSKLDIACGLFVLRRSVVSVSIRSVSVATSKNMLLYHTRVI